jgi:hypothetical protein
LLAIAGCSDAHSPTGIGAGPSGATSVDLALPVPGLVAAYGFNEASGSTVTDGSGQDNRGTLGTGVTRTSRGRYGRALAFNGQGMVTIPHAASLGLTASMTLEAWVNPARSSITGDWRDVIYKGDDNYYLMATSASNALPAGGASFGNTGSSTIEVFGTSPLRGNRWTHLAVTYDGATLRLYVNGALVSSRAYAGTFTTSTNPLRIGGNEFYGQFFQGLIDEVRVYNRPLSVAEILSDMNTPVGTAPVVTATSLSITRQPSSTAVSGVPFAQQPVIALRDASNNPVSQSGVVVTATIGSGGGVLGGTTTATTDASGAASFTNLSIVGTAGDRTLTFTAPGLAAATSTTIAVSVTTTVATRLLITTQPSSAAQSGVAFAQQPAIQLRDASNSPVSQSGVLVTATIATGDGTLGGTTTVATDANGVAAFTNLSITGTAGDRTLGFTSPGLTSATSNSISISGATSASLYPNRPASFTKSSEIDFSQAIPSLPDDIDRAISGALGWNMIYFGSNWSRTTDASAPQSAPAIWQGHWAPGSYGGGVIGSGGGHGIGNVFTYAPAGASRLYMSMRVKFDFDPYLWHPISNKFVNLEGDHSLILMQLKEGGNWRHAEELGFGSPYTSFFVDGGPDFPGEDHVPGQVDNRAVPNRQWVQIEVLIDIPNHVYKVWQDGVLTTNATPTFASTRINMVGIYAFRGGGGETLTTDLYYKYDHFFIAW